MKAMQIFELCKESLHEWWNDNTFQLGAAIAYYTIFSMAPILILVVAISSHVFGEEAARGRLAEELGSIAGEEVAQAVQTTIRQNYESGSTIWATLISVGVFGISATAVFGQLQQALNVVWGVQTRPDVSWRQTVKNRLWSFAMVLVIGFLLLVSLAINTAVGGHSRVGLLFVADFLIRSRVHRGLRQQVRKADGRGRPSRAGNKRSPRQARHVADEADAQDKRRIGRSSGNLWHKSPHRLQERFE
jgi:membrane protein